MNLGVVVAFGTAAVAPNLVVEHLVIVPARSFVSSPQAVGIDASYPQFVYSTAETTRILMADGGSTIGPPATPSSAVIEHGLGRRIEFPVGNVNMIARLSHLATDRPEVDGASDTSTHAATIHARVLPRFAFA